MQTESKSLAEINYEAIKLLCQHIGVVNTIRFINQWSIGYGNYVDDRHKLFEGMSVDDIANAIRHDKQQRQP